MQVSLPLRWHRLPLVGRDVVDGHFILDLLAPGPPSMVLAGRPTGDHAIKPWIARIDDAGARARLEWMEPWSPS